MAGNALDFWANIEQQYPEMGKLIKSVPEIAKILADASGGNWPSQKLTSAIQNSKWYTDQSDSQRTWQIRKLYNPGESAQETGQKVAEIMALGGRLGVKLTPDQIHDLADQSLGGAWDSTLLAQHMIGMASQKGLQPGTISATEDALRKTAADYGVALSSGTAYQWGSRIAGGSADQSGFADYVKGQAKLAHPYWEKQLDQGMTVRQLADPYVQTASQLLEVAPDAINLADHKWDFSQTDKTGAKTPLSQSDWANKIMSDHRFGWDTTTNAKQAAYQVVDNLRQSFGAK